MDTTNSEHEAGQRLFSIVSTLVSALNHQLRTPLSVVMNELDWLASSTSDPAVQRAVEKCLEIKSLLGVSRTIVVTPELGPVSAAELASTLSAQHNGEADTLLVADPRALARALEIIDSYLGTGARTIRHHQSVLVLSSGAQKGAVNSTLSGFLAGKVRDASVLEAARADLIILYHGGQFECCEGGYELSLPTWTRT